VGDVRGAIGGACAEWRDADISIDVEDLEVTTHEKVARVTINPTIEFLVRYDGDTDVESWASTHAFALIMSREWDGDAVNVDSYDAGVDPDDADFSTYDDVDNPLEDAQRQARIYRDTSAANASALSLSADLVQRVQNLVKAQGVDINALALIALWDVDTAHELALAENQLARYGPAATAH
jgi:hypothetical protein